MKARVAEVDGINRDDGIYIILKEHKHLHLLLFKI